MSLLGEAHRSLTIDQAAALLDVHRSRVSHRLRDHQLYAYRMGSQRRLPSWQFTSVSTPLLGLEVVLPALAADLHPASTCGEPPAAPHGSAVSLVHGQRFSQC